MPRSLATGRLLAPIVSVLGGAAMLAPLSGCEDPQRAVSAEARAAAVRVDSDAYATLGYRLEWRGFPIMNPGSRVAFFEVLGDVVAVQESSSIVSVLDARSGGYRCSDQLANPLTKFVGIVRDGKRIVSSSETDAYFLSTDTCTLVDRHALGKVVTTRPVLANGTLVYGTATGQVIGHLSHQAFNAWGNSIRGEITADPIAVGDSAVAVVSQVGEVLILDAASGAGLGRNQIHGGIWEDPNGGSSLAASPSTLFVASLDQSLYAFDAHSCSQLWRVRTDAPITARPVYHEGTVYCDLQSQGLTAFDSGTGAKRWAAEGVLGNVIAVHRGKLIVWDSASGTATTLDPASGQVIDRVHLPQIAFIRTDNFVDGNLYTVSPNGVVAKFIPRT